jgi:hypothetical protein
VWPTWRPYIWAFLAALILVRGAPSLIAELQHFEDYEALLTPDDRGCVYNGRLDFFQEWASARNVWNSLPAYTQHRITLERYLGVHVPDDSALLIEVNAHPPSSVLFALPLSFLSYSHALLAWNVLSLGALAASLWLIVRGLQIPFAGWSLLPILVLLWICLPLREHIIQGQLNLLILLLLTGTWTLDRSGRPFWAGTLLGVATVLKLFPGFLCVYFALRRQWTLLAGGFVAILFLSALTGAVLGFGTYAVYAQDVLPQVEWFRAGWNNASLTGFWSKLFDPVPENVRLWWRTEPLFYSPVAARAAFFCSAALLVALLARAVKKGHSRAYHDQTFGLAVTAMLLLAPVAWEHYLVILVLPLAIVWVNLSTRPLARALFLLVGVALWMLPPVLFSLAFVPGGHPYGIATPIHSLLVLSFQTYALVGLFMLGWPSRAWQQINESEAESAVQQDHRSVVGDRDSGDVAATSSIR